MREAVFNSEVTKSLKVAGAWAWKIPDQPVSMTRGRTRFTPEKPCDIIFAYGGVFGAVEGKMMKRFESFGLSALRDSQIRNLDEMAEKGNAGFVFLNVRIARTARTAYENRLIIFPWSEWRTKLEILPLSGEEVRALPFIPGRKKGFELQSFLSRVKT